MCVDVDVYVGACVWFRFQMVVWHSEAANNLSAWYTSAEWDGEQIDDGRYVRRSFFFLKFKCQK